MKYMGSKNRVAKHIVPILEESYYEDGCKMFIDACCGGCNLIDKIDPSIPRYANDINSYLISMFKGLQRGIKYPDIIDKTFYSDVRDCYNGKNNKYSDDIIGWVGFMGSYNGRFFDGGYSGHDVAVKGGFRDYISENINNINKQMMSLQDVTFSNKNLFDIKPKVKSLIYFDIPYKGTKQYTTSKNFDYDSFYEYCCHLSNQGHKVFISEYSMPDHFNCIWSLDIKTHMNQKAEKRTEKLFAI